MIVYQQLVGKLIYLACETRPNIAFVIKQLSRYNSDPQVSHICIIEQTLWYLKEISSIKIIWGRDPTSHQDDQM